MKLASYTIIISLFTMIFTGCKQKTEPVPEPEVISRPNLLFVIADQFRPQALGFTNEDPVITPNLDQLAAQGVYFKNAVSNRPLCSPYRAMLMTGKYLFSNGVLTNCNTSSRKYGNTLKEDETCFSDVLNDNGYYCGYIGKWHLDAPTQEEGPDVDDWQDAIWETYVPPGPKRHNFKFWHAYGCNNEHDNPYYWVNDAPVQDTLYPKEWSPIHEASVAIDFIQKNKSKPWALFVSMNPPHPPYNEVPDKYKQLYKNRPIDSLLNRPNVPEGKEGDQGRQSVKDYFAMVNGVDEQMGRILKELKESGQADNTIIVFTADHGEMMGSHGRMQKGVFYEESLRIPFIMRWPNGLDPGENDLHLSVPDVMPTLLSMMGMEQKIPKDVEGKNFKDVILVNSTNKPEFSLYFDCGPENPIEGYRGLRNDQYTFAILRDDKGKLVKYSLFDNINDPYQLKDIADESPELIKKLKSQLYGKLAQIHDPTVIFANQ